MARFGGRIAVVALAVSAAVACDDGTGAEREEILGLWGGVEYEFTSQADPGVSVDLIAEEGATYSINLVTDGTYQWQLSAPGSNASGTGTFDVRGDELILMAAAGGQRVFRFTFDQIFLRLVDDDAAYDFDGDGTAEAATHRMMLDRF